MKFKRFKQFTEDAPANAAGLGGVAGIGVGPQGEPGVNLKKKRKKDGDDPLVEDTDPETFAGARVFEVDSDRAWKARFGKNRYHKYKNYVGDDEIGEAIRQHGRSTKGDIILKDSTTSVMTFLRRKSRGNV